MLNIYSFDTPSKQKHFQYNESYVCIYPQNKCDPELLKTLTPVHNGWDFVDIFKFIVMNENMCINIT